MFGDMQSGSCAAQPRSRFSPQRSGGEVNSGGGASAPSVPDDSAPVLAALARLRPEGVVPEGRGDAVAVAVVLEVVAHVVFAQALAEVRPGDEVVDVVVGVVVEEVAEDEAGEDGEGGIAEDQPEGGE